MKINANALQKLQYFFSLIKWYKDCEKAPSPITEEILEQLFRDLGIEELSTITLFTFNEKTLAVRDFEEGFTHIDLEVFAQEYDDFVKFTYDYIADPVKMKDHTECKIMFDNIRTYRIFCYDFNTRKWELSNV